MLLYTDVYLSLNGAILSNNSHVLISDIGSTDNTALICNTNHPPVYGTSDDLHSGGEWYTPNGKAVKAGFLINRAPRMVRLKRNMATDPPSEGIYSCVVNVSAYAKNKQKTVYVGLYNNREGIYISFFV